MTSLCPCGNFIFPKNTKLKIFRNKAFDPQDATPKPNPIDCSLLHSNKDIFISNGQKFTTISSQINIVNSLSIISYIIDFENYIIIENQIKITIKSYNLNKILALIFIGNIGETNNLKNIKIYGDNIVLSPILSNDRIVLEIESICQEINETCCDKLPSSLTVSCILNPCEICIPQNE